MRCHLCEIDREEWEAEIRRLVKERDEVWDQLREMRSSCERWVEPLRELADRLHDEGVYWASATVRDASDALFRARFGEVE